MINLAADLQACEGFCSLCRYNFYTFGHAVRELHSSRGSREGNNAFLEVSIFLPRFHLALEFKLVLTWT